MALKRNERYPGRYSNPTTDHPQGAFKNRTAPSAQDGSYFEQDWTNDWDGFFGRLLTVAGITPDGGIDTALSSQYYDALKSVTFSNNPRMLIITSSQTVTSIPAWVTTIRVSACAGGGGGGSGGSNNTGQSSLVGGGGGGGGGAGQSILRKTYIITAGQPLSITIGSGGTGGTGVTTGGGVNGGAGGATSITGLFTLAGGTGGYAGGAVLSNTIGNGGSGGYGGEGYPAGGSGGDGNYAGNGGQGASTAFGGGGGGARAVKSNPVDSHLLGQPAFGYGAAGGGSGGAYGSASAINSYAGGDGAPGIVIIEW